MSETDAERGHRENWRQREKSLTEIPKELEDTIQKEVEAFTLPLLRRHYLGLQRYLKEIGWVQNQADWTEAVQRIHQLVEQIAIQEMEDD